MLRADGPFEVLEIMHTRLICLETMAF